MRVAGMGRIGSYVLQRIYFLQLNVLKSTVFFLKVVLTVKVEEEKWVRDC